MRNSKIALLSSAVCMALSSYASAQDSSWTPMLDKGTKEVSIAGRLEFPDFEKINYDIDTSYGYFVKDGWEVGAQIGAADFGGVDRIDVGVFTEYNKHC